MSQLSNSFDLEDCLILIADDNAITVQLIGAFLEKEGINYITCNNGSAALTLAKEKLPDLILLDVMMPQIDGFETCRLLKDNIETLDIPVIFLTAKTDTFNKIKGFSAGAVDYITKPFEKIEVMIRIRTQLKLKKALDKLTEYTRWLEKSLNEETEKGNTLIPDVNSN